MTEKRDPVAERRAELARRLAALSPEQRAKLAGTPVPPPAEARRTIPPRDTSAPAPMSFAQELLWRLELASPGHTYNVPRAVRLRGALDVDALQRALDTLVARHEAFRTTFALVDDEPRQIAHAPSPVAVERIDLTHVPAAEREDAARTRMLALAHRPFDLAHDPLLRAAVLRLGDDDHVLVLITHHVVSDGWSGGIVMRELGALYQAYRANKDVTPAEAGGLQQVPLQYADYAAWQRGTLSGERLQSLLDFWRDQLAGAPALLDLPTDRPRPIAPSFEGTVRLATLPVSTLERLRAFTRAEGATSFMVHTAALYALLHHYTGEEEIVIGTPVAGRPYPELEQVVGYFANTLLLRTSLGGAPTFRELLSRVRARTLAAYDHQEIPLETLLMTRLPDGRQLATVPQVVISTEDPDREWFRLAGTSAESFGASMGGAKFELGLWAAERADGLRIGIEYRTDLYDAETIDRLMQHYGVLLDAALTAPDTPVRDLPLLPPEERALVLHGFNDTAVDVPQHVTINDLVAARARTTPDRVAVEFEGRTLTDAALDAAAERLARRLAALGVRPGAIVAVFAERSLQLIVALLGTLKAGGAFMPIDPEYPPERAAYMLDDADARVVLTQSHLRANLPETRATVVAIDDLLADVTGEPSAAAEPTRPVATDAAYVLYTSGSTGRPKGVIVPHHCLVNHEYWFRDLAGITERDVVLHRTPLTFDPALCEVFSPLLFGARMVVAPPGGHKDLPLAAELMARTGVTVLQTVPSMLRILLDTRGIEQCTTVRLLMVGGEAMTPDLVARVRERMPWATLYNLYGPTETTIDATWYEVPVDDPPHVIPIGKAVGNMRAYVLAPNGSPSPIGVPGELFIGGAGVADGYLGRPDLTAQRFVADPFVAEARNVDPGVRREDTLDTARHPGVCREGTRGTARHPGESRDPSPPPEARMYKTGDRARWRRDGALEFLGRLDDQVKLRGIRIELGEVEAVLAAQSGVNAAAVAVHADGSGGERLVGYVVAEPGSELSVAAVREGAARALPPAVVPSVIVVLDALPLTSSGKVDRRALPAPAATDVEAVRPYVGPRTTIEFELVQIWERLLGTLGTGRRIGVHDDFFESGGHSLLAIQMLAEVERVRGARVPLAWLFESATIEGLATLLAKTQLGEAEPPLVVLQGDKRGQPIVFAHGDWTGGGYYLRRLAPLVAPDSPFYAIPMVRADEAEAAPTIEAMAARHVDEIRKLQPHGPYHIVGFCLGGVISFEIARQLEAAGERVERLVVVDGTPVNVPLRALRPLAALAERTAGIERRAAFMSRARWLRGRARYANAMPIGTRLRWSVRKVVNRVAWAVSGTPNGAAPAAAPDMSHVPNASTVPSTPPPAIVPDVVAEGVMVERVLERAASAYIPRRYGGTVDIVWAEGVPPRMRPPAPVELWEPIARALRVHRVASTHMGLIIENQPAFAAVLRRILFEGAPDPSRLITRD